MRASWTAVAAGAAAVCAGGLLGGGSPTAAATADAPSGFAHPRVNPYFPLRPGTVTRFRGSADGERLRETVRVTHRHRTIQGVRTVVVRDVLRRADGSLAESTRDWYASDHRGNVWYFGEATATYDEQGHLESREGSWRAGVDGAVRGLVMPARSPVPTAYRQELYRGAAEEQAWTVQRGLRVETPYGAVRHGLRSLEWTRLEPGVVSEKVYAPGLGIVRERDLSGGDERFALVSVTRSPQTGP